MSIFSIFGRRQEPAALPFSVDIHCHILPGVDDGSPDTATSVALVERMKSWGINRIIATPHMTECSFENTPETLDPALESLRGALAAKGIEMPVSRASENRLDDYFREQLEAGRIKPMPGGCLLVENSFIQEPWQLDQQLYDLRIKGYRPILAHPERYFYYHDKNLRRYTELHRSGTLFQINLLSLAGAYGKTEKKVAEQLIAAGMADLVGTDLHTMRHADLIDEYLATSEARRHFQALGGRIVNDRLFPSVGE